MTGIACRFIGVGSVYPRDSIARNCAASSPSSEKFISFILSICVFVPLWLVNTNHKGTKVTNGRRLPPGFAMSSTAAAVAAAITTTTATAAVAATATTTKTATATAATGTWFARLGFVHFERATADFLTIELANCGFAFFLRRHFDKTKTT